MRGDHHETPGKARAAEQVDIIINYAGGVRAQPIVHPRMRAAGLPACGTPHARNAYALMIRYQYLKSVVRDRM